LVHGRHLRGAAQNDGCHGFSCRQSLGVAIFLAKPH
jgi:hypothetical protein